MSKQPPVPPPDHPSQSMEHEGLVEALGMLPETQRFAVVAAVRSIPRPVPTGPYQLVVHEYTVNITIVGDIVKEKNVAIAKEGSTLNAAQGSGQNTATQNIGVLSPETQAKVDRELETLTGLVKLLVAQIPSDKQDLKDDAQLALRGLKQASSPESKKTADEKKVMWSVSGDGLLQAAKAVASLTGPITTSVKAILALLGS